MLPREEAIGHIKHAIEKTYRKRGDAVVRRNFDAVDATLAHLHAVAVPAAPTGSRRLPPVVADAAPDFGITQLRGQMSLAGQQQDEREHYRRTLRSWHLPASSIAGH